MEREKSTTPKGEPGKEPGEPPIIPREEIREEIIPPWEVERRKGVTELLEKYQETSKLERGTKKEIDQILRQEADQEMIKFAREWFKKNKNKIERRGYDTTSENEGYILKIVSEMGGFQDLEQNQDYKERIDNLYALKRDFERDIPPLDTQFLVLNTLNKRKKRIEEEIIEEEVEEIIKIREGEKKQGEKTEEDKIMIAAKEQELQKLLEIRRELAEKLTGRNLRNEAKKEMRNWKRTDRGKEAIKETRLMAEEEWETKKKGIIDKRIEVPGKGKLNREEFMSYSIQERISHQEKNIIEERIAEIGERQVEIIENMYDRIKERLITESREKNLKKEKKTAEQLAAIKKEFEKIGKTTIGKVINEVTKREGLEDLTGNLENDSEKFRSFLGGLDILPEDYLDEDWESIMERHKKKYQPGVVKSEIGFLGFIFDLIFEIIKPEKEK